jgi:WD40 repeat protein
MAVSPDGSRVLTGTRDGLIQMWDPRNWQEVRRLGRVDRAVLSLAFAPDGRTALSGEGKCERSDDSSGTDEGVVRLWDMPTGEKIRTFHGHAGPVYSVAFSADGNYALSAGTDKTVRLWSLDTGRELRRFEGHLSTVRSVTFSPDGYLALSGSLDRSVRLWDTVLPERSP